MSQRSSQYKKDASPSTKKLLRNWGSWINLVVRSSFPECKHWISALWIFKRVQCRSKAAASDTEERYDKNKHWHRQAFHVNVVLLVYIASFRASKSLTYACENP